MLWNKVKNVKYGLTSQKPHPSALSKLKIPVGKLKTCRQIHVFTNKT